MVTYDLLSLRLFIAVVDHRNIARAAKANNIAASAVSKRISELEARIGSPLLTRMREGVAPAAAGEVLYRHAQRMSAIAEELEADLKRTVAGIEGSVSLWTEHSAIGQYLPLDLISFANEFRNVEVRVVERHSIDVIEAVRTGAADIGIVSNADVPDLDALPYRQIRLVLITPVGHPLAQRSSALAKDIQAFGNVGLDLAETSDDMVTGKSSRLSTRVLNFESIRRIVSAGLGVAVLPDGAVIPFCDQRTFSVVEIDESWAQRSFRLYVRQRVDLQLAARILVDRLSASSPISK